MFNSRVLSSLCLAAALCVFTGLSASGQTAKSAAPKAAPPAKAAANPTAAPKAEAPLLPAAFAGWELAEAKPVTDAALMVAANAAALKEFGFTDGSLASYTRGSGTLKLKALRFADASGAYGAYSFFRHSGWPREEIGSGAASDNNRVLFWVGNVFVDVELTRLSAMSASELRELAAAIPVPAGNKSLPPPVLGNLPPKELDKQTSHYALGPAGYIGSTGSADPFGVLPPDLVGFDRGAETVTASYTLRSGPATLTIINYPTPQLAAGQEKAIAAYLKAGNSPQHPFTKPLQESNPAALEVRRSGPLLAIVSGDAIPDEAHKLISLVHYDADMSALPGGGSANDIQKTAQLLLGIVTLVVVMFVAAFLLAIFLGGGRAAFRFMRGKPLSSMNDEQFTKLDL